MEIVTSQEYESFVLKDSAPTLPLAELAISSALACADLSRPKK